MSEAKSRPPAPIKKLLILDERLTDQFVKWADKFMTFRSMRIHYKALEISCHGIPWLAFWIAFTWLFNNQHLVQMQVNILFGLIMDIVFVALIKAYIRRKRPKTNRNDAIAEMGPDVYSFPSGHASRAAFVAYFFINLHPVWFIFYPPIVAWATAVSITRILLNRHHILDVAAGVLLGIFEGVLLGFLWIGEDTAKWLMNYITDERLEGGEYHV